MNQDATMGDAIMGHAISLRVVANDLYQNFSQMVQMAREGKLPADDKTQQSRMAGYAFSMVILRALATELTLKAISFKKTGQYRKDKKGHDLLILLNDLDDATKKIIAKVADSQGVAPLDQILSKHRGDFVNWRYPAEGGKIHVEFLDIDKALEVLMTVYRHKDFVRLCSSQKKDSGNAGR